MINSISFNNSIESGLNSKRTKAAKDVPMMSLEAPTADKLLSFHLDGATNRQSQNTAKPTRVTLETIKMLKKLNGAQGEKHEEKAAELTGDKKPKATKPDELTPAGRADADDNQLRSSTLPKPPTALISDSRPLVIKPALITKAIVNASSSPRLGRRKGGALMPGHLVAPPPRRMRSQLRRSPPAAPRSDRSVYRSARRRARYYEMIAKEQKAWQRHYA